MEFYVISDATLTSVADAIRAKAGIDKELVFPTEFIEKIEALSPEYDGSYIITPSVTEQVFNTKGKTMKDNLTINEIPYTEVSNTSGGTTARIGFLDEVTNNV